MANQSAQFSYLTRAQFRTELSTRLNDPSNIFWTAAELNLYLTESLSLWNVLTQYWPQDYTFSVNPPLSSDWIAVNPSGSPRQQTYTESDAYSIILYHLMEPQLSSGSWAGTSQFNLQTLQQSVQNKLNEIMQETGTRTQEYVKSDGWVPITSRFYLPDTILDVSRVRYVGVDGSTVTLSRGDSASFLRFSPQYRQTEGPPSRWDVLGSPPLALTVDTMVNQPNSVQILAMYAANQLNPANPQPLFIPNDWLWVLKYGALADLYLNAPEATDEARGQYCLQRYQEGLKLMKNMPWLLNGFINGVAVDTPPVIGKDRFSYEWQSNPSAWPGIVVGEIDLIAVCPIPTSTTSVMLTVVGNAPQPASDSAFIQAPRDVIDVLLDYCQHVAYLKCGGYEVKQSVSLYQNLIRYAVSTSLRLRKSGIFSTDLRPPVSRQELEEPRFAQKGAK